MFATKSSRLTRFTVALQERIDFIAAAYLIVPLALFLALTFRPLVGVILLALLLLGSLPLVVSVRRNPSPAPFGWKTILGILIAACACSLLTGRDQIVYHLGDWSKHFGVMQDLRDHSWPVTYGTEPNGAPEVLRYYAGFHVVPALLAKLFGSLTVWVFVWKALGIFLVFMIVLRRLSTTGRRIVTGIALIAFGGLDVVGAFWVRGTLDGLGWGSTHFNAWAVSQYNGSAVLLGAVPNQALAGWIGLLLFIDRGRDRSFVMAAPILTAAVAFGSLFAVVGLVPFAVVPIARSIAKSRGRYVINPSVLAGALVALLVAAYLIADTGNNPHGFVWQLFPHTNVVYGSWVLVAFDVLPLAVTLILTGIRIKASTYLALVLLCLFPFYIFGASSDFTMRASIPAWMALFLQVCLVIERQRAGLKWLMTLRIVPLVLVLLVGSATNVFEIQRSIKPLTTVSTEVKVPSGVLAVVGDAVPDAQYLAVEPPFISRLLNHPKIDFAYKSIQTNEMNWTVDPSIDSAKPKLSVAPDGVVASVSNPGAMSLELATGLPPDQYRLRAVITVNRSAVLHQITFKFGNVVERLEPSGNQILIDDYVYPGFPINPLVLTADRLVPGDVLSLRSLTIESVARAR